MEKPPLIVNGMFGMGDNLHQRAIIRQLMEHHEVWLNTTWVALYHDLIAQGLHVVRKQTALRTQAKNQQREAALFDRSGPPPNTPSISLMYSGHNVRRQPSQTILSAMCESAGMGISYARADYRLPVPQTWLDAADRIIAEFDRGHKPLLIYRPLVERPEWSGGGLRNADPVDYAELFRHFRDEFFVVSIADLQPGREWMIGPRLHADIEFHGGELPFETLAAMFQRAKMVYTSSGFATILAPAVGTPVISVTGGFERAVWHESGAKFAPYLGIESANPCECATSSCRRGCDKKLDMRKEMERVDSFLRSTVDVGISIGRPFDDVFGAAIDSNQVVSSGGARYSMRPPYHPVQGLRA